MEMDRLGGGRKPIWGGLGYPPSPPKGAPSLVVLRAPVDLGASRAKRVFQRQKCISTRQRPRIRPSCAHSGFRGLRGRPAGVRVERGSRDVRGDCRGGHLEGSLEQPRARDGPGENERVPAISDRPQLRNQEGQLNCTRCSPGYVADDARVTCIACPAGEEEVVEYAQGFCSACGSSTIGTRSR